MRFRRAPFNVVVQALPFLEGIVDTYVKYPETDDLDTMSISFAQDNGTDIWRSEHLQFDVDAWSYRDFDHGVTLPLLMKNSTPSSVQKSAPMKWRKCINAQSNTSRPKKNCWRSTALKWPNTSKAMKEFGSLHIGLLFL